MAGTVADPVVPRHRAKRNHHRDTIGDHLSPPRLLACCVADVLGKVTEACRLTGISRTRYYEWRQIVVQCGIKALMPKTRRTPQPQTAHRPTSWGTC